MDITKCTGEQCPFKEKCYRYTAIANPYRQAYFSIAPSIQDFIEPDKCDYYIEDEITETEFADKVLR